MSITLKEGTTSEEALDEAADKLENLRLGQMARPDCVNPEISAENVNHANAPTNIVKLDMNDNI
jgi:hypothetical protein